MYSKSPKSQQQQQQHKQTKEIIINDNSNIEHKNRNEDIETQEKYYWKVIITLSICLLCHSYLIISVFPYSGFMAIHLIENANHENAGSYAGLLASSFMVGRVLSSYHWGKLADYMGRKFVLCISLGLSIILSLAFGLATTFQTALIVRFFMGMSNGILGTTKTLVSELAHGNEALETKGMGIVLGMWGWGFLICPALSGILSEPVSQYPNSRLVQEQFFDFLSEYPFVLPNILGSILCSIALLCVFLVIEETLVDENSLTSSHQIQKEPLGDRIGNRLHSWRNLSSIKLYFYSDEDETEVEEEEAAFLFPKPNEKEHRKDYESINVVDSNTQNCNSSDIDIIEENPVDIEYIEKNLEEYTQPLQAEIVQKQSPPTMKSIWSITPIRHHLLLQWSFSFVNVLKDEAFPLFCLSQQAGLCLSEAEIGKILSASGFFFALFQYAIYSKVLHTFGLLHSMYIGIGVSLPVVMFIPFSLYLNNGMECGTMSLQAFLFLSILLAINRIFASVFFTSVSIATNRIVPSSHRGTMNGLSVVGGSVSKALGPAVAGILVAFCVSSGVFSNPAVGSYVVFGLVGFSGVFVGFVAYHFLNEYDYDNIKCI